MPTPLEARQRASAASNAASDTYDTAALSFWEYFGRNTIRHLNLNPGEQVLDVASGSGASAIPPAHAVGSTGSVIAVDLAEKLLALAQAKAQAQNLTNIRFEPGDMMAL